MSKFFCGVNGLECWLGNRKSTCLCTPDPKVSMDAVAYRIDEPFEICPKGGTILLSISSVR